MKVQNQKLANQEIVLSTYGNVQFDGEGIAEVTDEALCQELATLPFFSTVTEEVEPTPEVKTETPKKNIKK